MNLTGLGLALFTAIAKWSDSFAAISLFPFREYTGLASWVYGAIWGLGYVAAELPNSVVKRRLEIHPGERATGAWRTRFVFVDQADSPLGCRLAMYVFYTPIFLVLAEFSRWG